MQRRRKRALCFVRAAAPMIKLRTPFVSVAVTGFLSLTEDRVRLVHECIERCGGTLLSDRSLRNLPWYRPGKMVHLPCSGILFVHSRLAGVELCSGTQVEEEAQSSTCRCRS